MGERKYHAFRCVTVHAGLGGSVASTLPVVTILGVGSGGVRDGALRSGSGNRGSRHDWSRRENGGKPRGKSRSTYS